MAAMLPEGDMPSGEGQRYSACVMHSFASRIRAVEKCAARMAPVGARRAPTAKKNLDAYAEAQEGWDCLDVCV